MIESDRNLNYIEPMFDEVTETVQPALPHGIECDTD